MNKQQLDNIISFTFNFHFQCGENLIGFSPDYIIEKWDKYIGIKCKSNFVSQEYYDIDPLLKNSKIHKWVKRWGVTKEDFIEIKEILLLIRRINSKALLEMSYVETYEKWNLEDLMDLFSEFINIEEINNREYRGLHEVLKMQLNKFLNTKENKRAYNLYLLLNNEENEKI